MKRLFQQPAGLIEEIGFAPDGTAVISRIIRQGIVFSLGALAVYFFLPQIVAVLATTSELRTVNIGWILLAVISQVISFSFMWTLTRSVLPSVSWFVASTSQLTANAVSRMVPGGAAIGGATLYRMLSVSGVRPAQAAGALAATSILSTAMLFALPATGVLVAVVGAPIPDALWPPAVAGALLFFFLGSLAMVAIRFDRPLELLASAIDRVARLNNGRFGRPTSYDSQRLVAERDRLVDLIGSGWPKVVFAAACNWGFDFLSLVFCLWAVGAQPRLALILVAFTGSAVLSMIPITPGGFGFVEAGLVSMLVVAGVTNQDALIATLAYRIVSLWLPIVSGVVAWFAFRARYPRATAVSRDHEPVTSGR